MAAISLSRISVHSILFLALCAYAVFFFRLVEVSKFGPNSTHQWRQSDSASQAMTYYEEELPFFNHKVHNLAGDQGEAVSEFPLLYYLAAIFYRIFGPHDVILRLLNYLILLTGIYAFSRILLDLTKNPLLSVAVSGILLGSPLLNFYGFGFIKRPFISVINPY